MVAVGADGPERAVLELLDAYEGLEREDGQSGEVVVSGSFALDATYDGIRLVEDFKLRLLVPGDYPESLPAVKEVSGIIGSEYEHLYRDGTLCLGVQGELLLSQLENPSLVAFLDGPVRSYLYSYLFRKRYGRYPFGDRAHGAAGILQYYGELFEEADPVAVVALLEAVCADGYRGHLPCPCGSGLIGRKCHGRLIIDLKRSRALSAFSSDLQVIARELAEWRRSSQK